MFTLIFAGLENRPETAKYTLQAETKMRSGFNWSLLDRNNLYSMLYSAGREVVGKKLPVNQLQLILSQHIKRKLPVKVIKYRRDFKQKPGIVYMGGTYDSYLDQTNRKRFIEIIVSYHPEDRVIKLTEYKWSRLCELFADTVLHEIIHMRQYRSRNFKDIPGYESTAHYHKQRVDQEYYGHRDEMGAFSFNIACEMLDRFGNNPRAIRKYMDSMQAKRYKKTIYHKFLAAFDWDHSHVKVRQMKMKILQQLEYAELGKPFKTTNFLTY